MFWFMEALNLPLTWSSGAHYSLRVEATCGMKELRDCPILPSLLLGRAPSVVPCPGPSSPFPPFETNVRLNSIREGRPPPPPSSSSSLSFYFPFFFLFLRLVLFSYLSHKFILPTRSLPLSLVHSYHPLLPDSLSLNISFYLLSDLLGFCICHYCS